MDDQEMIGSVHNDGVFSLFPRHLENDLDLYNLGMNGP